MTICHTIRHLECLAALAAALLAGAPTIAVADGDVFSEVTRLVNNRGVFNRNGLVPEVRITSPLAGAVVAPGNPRIGAGDPNGTGFAIVRKSSRATTTM